MQTTIWTRLEAGTSQREIERVTRIDRKTIRAYQKRFVLRNQSVDHAQSQTVVVGGHDSVPRRGHTRSIHCFPLRLNAGAAKVSLMDNYGASLDSIFHALADPTRRAIVQRLGRGPATVTELAQPFAMALPSLMKHVGVLEETGLIRSTKTGRVRTCVLERKKLATVELWLGEQRAVWQARYGNLDELLTKLNGEDDEN